MELANSNEDEIFDISKISLSKEMSSDQRTAILAIMEKLRKHNVKHIIDAHSVLEKINQ